MFTVTLNPTKIKQEKGRKGVSLLKRFLPFLPSSCLILGRMQRDSEWRRYPEPIRAMFTVALYPTKDQTREREKGS